MKTKLLSMALVPLLSGGCLITPGGGADKTLERGSKIPGEIGVALDIARSLLVKGGVAKDPLDGFNYYFYYYEVQEDGSRRTLDPTKLIFREGYDREAGINASVFNQTTNAPPIGPVADRDRQNREQLEDLIKLLEAFENED